MHALLLVANVIAMHTTEMPLVLDGCNTASAVRAAEIREMAPEDPNTLASIADLLLEPDGATCLMESWVLVNVYRAQPGSEIVAHTLVSGLASSQPHIAARAARLVRVLGVADPKAFLNLIHRREMTSNAWSVLRNDLGSMMSSPRKDVLAFALEATAPVATASQAE
ncbi:MAG: hypothetical protein U1F43_33465 [Myxococcota bacterium]